MRIRQISRSAVSLSCLMAMVLMSASSPATALGKNDGTEHYCASLSTRADAIQKRLDDRQQTLNGAWQQQDQQLDVYRTSQAEKIQGLRADVDADRSKNIAELRAKAGSDAARQAVDAYAAAVAEAIQARREAVDQARATFQKGVKTVIENHQATLSGRVQALRIGLSDAYATAEASCSEQVPPVTVRTTLMQSLEASRQNFTDKAKGDGDDALQIQRLAMQRRASVKVANDAYKTAATAARAALQDALSPQAGAAT